MKLHVIDYKVTPNSAAEIIKITGLNSTADIKAPGEGVAQLAAGGTSDLASASQPLLDAIATYVSSKTHPVEATPDAIWAHWNPAPKSIADRLMEDTGDKTSPKTKAPKVPKAPKAPKAPKVPSEKAPKGNKKDLTVVPVDGTKAISGDEAGNTGTNPKGGKMKKATKKATKKVAKKAAKRVTSDKPRGEKMAKLKSMLTRTSGCTRAQMTEALGWKTLSFQAAAKSLKLKLKKVKDPGKPSVYFGS